MKSETCGIFVPTLGMKILKYQKQLFLSSAKPYINQVTDSEVKMKLIFMLNDF